VYKITIKVSDIYSVIDLEVILTKYGKDSNQKQQEKYHIQYGGENLENFLHHPERCSMKRV